MKEEQETITRNDLARALYPEIGSMSDAYRFVCVFFEVLGDQIAETGEVKIHGFGRFRCLEKNQRQGRNPKTGESVPIQARRVVSFIAGGKFKKMMDAGEED